MGKLLPIFGDVKLSIGALALVAISYFLLGDLTLIPLPILLVIAVMLFAGSGGLVENALRSLTSHLVGPHQQGLVGGASQSTVSLAMILGLLLGGLLDAQFGHVLLVWDADYCPDYYLRCPGYPCPGQTEVRRKNGNTCITAGRPAALGGM